MTRGFHSYIFRAASAKASAAKAPAIGAAAATLLLVHGALRLRNRNQGWVELNERSVHCAVLSVARVAGCSGRYLLCRLRAVWETEERPLAGKAFVFHVNFQIH